MYYGGILALTLCLIFVNEGSSFDSNFLSRDLDLLGVQKRDAGSSILCDCQEFKIFTGKKRRDDAMTACEDDGGTLAEIFDADTDELLRTTINNNNMAEGLKGFWIGITDRVTEDTFVWPSGDTLLDCSYTRWAPKNPNNKINPKKSGDEVGQNCAQLWAKNDLMWDDDFCVKKKGYICQYQATCPGECDACAA